LAPAGLELASPLATDSATEPVRNRPMCRKELRVTHDTMNGV